MQTISNTTISRKTSATKEQFAEENKGNLLLNYSVYYLLSTIHKALSMNAPPHVASYGFILASSSLVYVYIGCEALILFVNGHNIFRLYTSFSLLLYSIKNHLSPTGYSCITPGSKPPILARQSWASLSGASTLKIGVWM